MRKITFLLLLVVLINSCSTRTDNEAKVMGDFCSSIHCDTTAALSEKLDSLSELMQHKTGVYPLEDGGGAMMARAWLCENAEKTIDVQYFIFSLDNVGLIAVDYLVRAADRGVK